MVYKSLILSFALGLLLVIPGYSLLSLAGKLKKHGNFFSLSLPRIILTSFFISIGSYALIAIVFSYLSVPFGKVWLIWLVLGGLTLVTARQDLPYLTSQIRRLLLSRWNICSTLVILAAFIILSIQGGLLDRLADGWWHMAYANQMILENSAWISNHPLVGKELRSPSILYPPIWHTNLALLSSGLGIALPVIWHAIAGPIVVFTCLAFFLLVDSLTKSSKICFLSLVLLLFLVGGLNSYLRVSPWPANIAYIGLYFALSETFRVSDALETRARTSYLNLFKIDSDHTLLHLVGIGALGFLLIGLHGVEAVLYLFAITAYLAGLSLTKETHSVPKLQIERAFFFWLIFVLIGFGFLLAFLFLKGYLAELLLLPKSKAPYLNFVVPTILGSLIVILGWINCSERRNSEKGFWKVAWWIAWAGLLLLLIAVVDFSHISALFAPEDYGRHVPRAFQDRFGNRVWLPWWDHQLRGAFLFSGFVGIFCAIFALTKERSRATIFIFSNTVLVILILTSPYLFSMSSFLIPLGSTYRVHMLLFTPISIAIFLSYMFPAHDSSR